MTDTSLRTEVKVDALAQDNCPHDTRSNSGQFPVAVRRSGFAAFTLHASPLRVADVPTVILLSSASLVGESAFIFYPAPPGGDFTSLCPVLASSLQLHIQAAGGGVATLTGESNII
ncbi:hypothetical protein SAY86_000098 [Trapa natans]|uniref:Uncharacterized protein n=1 Tax=Trapa natans TaxID=22666 RepID=A0AAN7MTV5_TRANT|nr:hypothetical protein SAY86_000098 [Trapa natans]